MEVRRYRLGSDEKLWNQFISTAKNSTFLFNRSFMEYHKDRFKDHSLLVFNKNKLIACFPANEKDEATVAAHQGLTYGGVIIESNSKLLVQIEIFQAILKYYSDAGFSKLLYKAFPRFYNLLQTDEIEYCLFLCGAKLYRRDTAIAVDKQNQISYSGNIRREAVKAKNEGITIKQDYDFTSFWNQVLTPNLVDRFEVKPVHSVEEIELLKSRFPEQIKLFTATDKANNILAGTVFFLTENVAHCQYISASDEGRKTGALNHLFVTLLDEYFPEQRFFDLGIANENNGKKLNKGLLAWKERLGGRTYSHDFYEINTQTLLTINSNLDE